MKVRVTAKIDEAEMDRAILDALDAWEREHPEEGIADDGERDYHLREVRALFGRFDSNSPGLGLELDTEDGSFVVIGTPRLVDGRAVRPAPEAGDAPR